MSTTSRRRKRPHEWENNLYLHSQNNELIISEPTIPPPALPVVPPIVNHSRTLHPQMPPLSELQMAQYKRPKNQNPSYESLRQIQMPINDPYTPLINYHNTPEHSNYLSYHQAQLTSLPIPNYSDRVQPYVPVILRNTAAFICLFIFILIYFHSIPIQIYLIFLLLQL
jgi:hypothetical protein